VEKIVKEKNKKEVKKCGSKKKKEEVKNAVEIEYTLTG